MTIEDEPLLKEFRKPGFCEICATWCKDGRDPHHYHHTGLGGGSRLDIRENLLSVCRECHTGIHMGKISRVQLLWLLGQREEKSPSEIQEHIWKLLREKK